MTRRFRLKDGKIYHGAELIGHYARCQFGSFAVGYQIEWDNGTTALADSEAFILTLAKQYCS